MGPWNISPIGILHTPFKEKFGIPRQPGLAPHAWGRLELTPPFDRPEMWRGLGPKALVWVTFVFHEAVGEGWKSTVRPPRLGGKERLGTFATRSPHRPNFLGQSLLEISRLEEKNGRMSLHLSGVDILDGTPVIDVRPYVAEVEARQNPVPGPFSGVARPALPVHLSPAASAFCEENKALYPHLRELLCEILGLDPRPAFQQGVQGCYAMRLEDFDVDWHIQFGTQGEFAVVDGLRPVHLKSAHE